MASLFGTEDECQQTVIKRTILSHLTRSTWGLTIEEISDQTGYHRNTVSKYLMILEAMGLVDYKTYGKTKVWFPSHSTLELRAKMPRIVLEAVGKGLHKLARKDSLELVYNIAREVSLESTKELKKYFAGEQFKLPFVLGHLSDYHPILMGSLEIKSEKKGENWVIYAKGCYCHQDPQFPEGCMLTAGGVAGIVEALIDAPVKVEKITNIDMEEVLANGCQFKIIIPPKLVSA